jgi:hypothetical protein
MEFVSDLLKEAWFAEGFEDAIAWKDNSICQLGIKVVA